MTGRRPRRESGEAARSGGRSNYRKGKRIAIIISIEKKRNNRDADKYRNVTVRSRLQGAVETPAEYGRRIAGQYKRRLPRGFLGKDEDT